MGRSFFIGIRNRQGHTASTLGPHRARNRRRLGDHQLPAKVRSHRLFRGPNGCSARMIRMDVAQLIYARSVTEPMPYSVGISA